MTTFETYSKRQKKRERAGQLEVYQYDSLPIAFRIQVIHIWSSAIGHYIVNSLRPDPVSNKIWFLIQNTLCRELGVFDLGNKSPDLSFQCQQFLLTTDTEGALDIIDLSFQCIDQKVRDLYPVDQQDAGITQSADNAIAELNFRFKEHGIGYQFDGGELMRVDSQFIHAQVVKPAISLLRDLEFLGAENEFLHAHEHYRKGNYKEAIVDALKAFESTMKAICHARNWTFSPNDSAKDLIKIMFDNGLLPATLQTYFAGLRSVLESGLPTVRNKTSGHGQGVNIVEVPEYIASFALHSAATNIVFLVEAHKAKK